MYRSSPNWVLTQVVNNNSAAYFTGCTDVGVPIPGNPSPSLVTQLPNRPMDQTLKPQHWTENGQPKPREDCTPGSFTQMASVTKGVKRHLEVGGTPVGNPSSRGNGAVKRRIISGRSSPQNEDAAANQTQQLQPPQKRALTITPPPSTVPSMPPGLLQNNEWDKLSTAIWDKVLECQQPDEMYMRKMYLRDALYKIFQDKYPACGLFIVGSSLNGFGINTSDMDMCLMLTQNEIDQKNEATSILRFLLRELKKCNFIRNLELIQAKVPILKFQDAISGVEVDLNINNSVGIRNTHLLKCYASLDWRLRPLIIIIKLWAKHKDINDAKNMTISSYSLVLMVIHYLQYGVLDGVSPPVLPCLHKLYPFKFLPGSDVRSISLKEELVPFHSQNIQSLGQLLLGFMDYYANQFDFRSEAISVRTGGTLPKRFVQNQVARKNNPGQWKYLCIEEPFDMTNTARSVYDDIVFERVKMVFRTSWNRLRETKNLADILQET